MRHSWILVLMLAAALSLLPGCDSDIKGKEGSDRLKIVATTGMVADLVRNIAGDRASVTSLMGEGVDPHLYKPTRADMSALTRSDVVFYNGLFLEGKMTDTLTRLADSGRRVHAVTAGFSADQLLHPEDFESHPDPHVWMDPLLWEKAAQHVCEQLIAADPAGADAYNAATAEYRGRLQALQAYATEALGSVPESSRTLITAHDAFNYFGRRYGFEVVGIQGISTESEAGVRNVETLVELLVSKKIPAVFIETTVSERNISALIAGARARGHEVRIGGSLYSDAMGKPDSYEGTYIGMIDHNVTTIVRALGGRAPERGFQGQLKDSR